MMVMRSRKLTLTLVSADNLPHVRKNGVMKVYAKVSLNGKSNSKKRSPMDMTGETNPRWNFSVDYTMNESAVRSKEAGLEVVVELYYERMMGLGDRLIGQVKLPVNSLFVKKSSGGVKKVSYSVEGTEKGKLKILYGFGGMFLVPKPSKWKQITKKVLTLVVHGVWFLFTGDTGDWFYSIEN